ncbi:MAG: hypothetical protein AMXMBFR82_10770 [Candidatus Hydrogenedentota bacterium]
MYDCGGPAPARHVLGNYEIFEEVGRGGMGIVYRALDLSLDRIVAVKVLRDDLRSQPQIVSRFSREAKAAACLDHPNIVQIYAVGNSDGTPYIAMEFIDAIPLSTLMQRESALPCNQALDIAAQVASALACAHESHVIHRDIKPPNILIADDGKAYVTDFGIAKILTMDDNLTVDGSRLGTPHYMSPERCKNGELTVSSDLYSLGVLLFQMLTGRLPYEAGSNIELIRKIVSDPPARLRRYRNELAEDVERLVAWMIEKQPHHRPPDGNAVRDAIGRVRRGMPLDLKTNTVSAAIADFRSAVEKRPDTATPAEKPRRRFASVTPFTESTRASAGSWTLRGAAILAVLLCLIGGAHWFAGTDATTVSTWDPQMTDPDLWFADPRVARFKDEAPGVLRAPLSLAAFSIDSLSRGDRATFKVELQGAVGSHQEGRRIVCELDPGLQVATLLGTPYLAPSAVQWGGSEDLRDALRAAVSENAVAIAVHPDGMRFAVAAEDTQGNSDLTEWTRSPDGSIAAARKLASPGAPIEDLQYAPGGEWIAFTRHHGPVDRSLWLIPTTPTPADPEPIARGDLSLSNRAFSPDGQTLAYAIASSAGKSAVRLVRTVDRQIAMELGEGWDVSWLPSGGALVGVASDRKGFNQLWVFGVEAPYPRTQLTHLDGGTARDCALSGDGGWVAAALNSTAEPALVFARIGTTAR